MRCTSGTLGFTLGRPSGTEGWRWCSPAVEGVHGEVHQLAEGQGDGLVRGGVEGGHLVHDALGVMPVADAEQRLQETQLLVVWRL